MSVWEVIPFLPLCGRGVRDGLEALLDDGVGNEHAGAGEGEARAFRAFVHAGKALGAEPGDEGGVVGREVAPGEAAVLVQRQAACGAKAQHHQLFGLLAEGKFLAELRPGALAAQGGETLMLGKTEGRRRRGRQRM